MGATKIKLCGMFRPEDIAAVNAARPDFCGFVVDCPRSKRNVSPERAAGLASGLDRGIQAVGVFVDEPVDVVARLAKSSLSVIQLHGHEDEEYIRKLRSLVDVPIWKAFKVGGAEDLAAAKKSAADRVLLDSGAGSGKTFDWTLLADAGRPYVLAGGLGPENVASAVERLHPWAVDMSSGIETDGVKDSAKMRAAVAAVRSAA
ncbi:phosphoribosylanthranilate isomerase [Olsenella sp. Marseille-P4559]|uniref:phosphoribosylanthranilate isomerase n=1 Tax=Olsenella sp. Marseille-P4559 TaxID=2364795 RepID=UPI001A9115FA|nr:phosphoribosylanthranilate isomerase [Olsenella sp. Marseille-P4559]